MCGSVFKNDLKVVLVTMKRQNSSENDQEGYKEPRLADESGSLNRSVRTILRRSIELRQAQQSEESASKSEDNSTLRHWAALLSNAGFSCELRPIVESDSSPFPVEGKAPSLALIVEQTKSLRFSVTTGPFQSVRLVFYPDGEWRLDSPICEHQKIAGGRLSFPVESTELESIARKWLSKNHVLCPGLVALVGLDLQKELGYNPKNVKVMNGNLYSKDCKIWHANNNNHYRKADSVKQNMCGNCLVCERYTKTTLENRKSLDTAKREERRKPGSNYPIQYLSPRSKSLRLGNTRQVRSRMARKVKKLYRQTRMELPQEQSSELCKLVEAIEKSSEGKELSKIFKEGNQYKDAKGGKAGNFVKDIWEKDRETFFKDQRKNGEFLT